MPISVMQSLSIIIVVSFFTILLRAFPFLVFGGKRKVPTAIRYLGAVLPSSIMVILVVYCLRFINFSSMARFLPYIIAGFLVVMLHVWKKNILLSILGGTVCYMFLVQVVFV